MDKYVWIVELETALEYSEPSKEILAIYLEKPTFLKLSETLGFTNPIIGKLLRNGCVDTGQHTELNLYKHIVS